MFTLPPLERVSRQGFSGVTDQPLPPVLSPLPTPLISSKKRTYDISGDSSSVTTLNPKRTRNQDTTAAITLGVTAGRPSSSTVDPSLPLVISEGSQSTQIVQATNAGPLEVEVAPLAYPVLATAPLPVVNPAPDTFPPISSPNGSIAFMENPTTPQQFLQQHASHPMITLPGAPLPTESQNKN